ncbi:MAG TPA: helix-turn-helix domain-containing protein [Polyangiaceae bacterium]|nr:helix-turn-helix domain-containing protein [Polyangiaceae bacterium]
MRYLVHRPGQPLSGLVDHLWFLSDAPSHARERILPSATVELVFNLAESDGRRYEAPGRPGSYHMIPWAVVSGCYSTPFEIDTRTHAAIMGVHFRPGGAAAFLGAPPGEIADTHVALEAMWGRGTNELQERLCGAADPREGFRVLEEALRGRLVRGRRERDAVKHARFALDQPGAEVGQLARDIGLSRRRLIEIFTADVGMTPKRYARVRRFQRALALAEASPSPRWAGLAFECGYYDQAHLCREWAELTGVSPSEFVSLRRRPVKENHLALPEGEAPRRPRRALG